MARVLSKPPHVELFIHRQTLANVVRFSTPELAELEARITQAADRALAIELDIFARLTEAVLAEEQRAGGGERRACRARPLCRPRRACCRSRTMCGPRSTASLVFAVEEGRHPMVEQNLRRSDGGELRRQRLHARRAGTARASSW